MSAPTAAIVPSTAFYLALLESLRDVLGDRAAAALVQYAAAEAATRETVDRPTLDESRAFSTALERLGEILGARFRVAESTSEVVVVEAHGTLAVRGDAVACALLAGAVRGAFAARAKTPLASVESALDGTGALRITMRRLPRGG